MTDQKKAVVLSSGGLDSTTVMAIAKHEGFRILSLSFDYGQRHAGELDAAKRIAGVMGAEKHVIAKIDLRIFGGSALTDDIAVPKGRSRKEMEGDIPVTYVPARNTIFLSYALAYAEVNKSGHIFIGVNALDYSGYPDCRPEYIKSFQQTANLATKAGVEGKIPIVIETPLISMSKADIILKGTELGVDYRLTHSCYDPVLLRNSQWGACGKCDSCILRKKGFIEAKIEDPTIYA